MAAPTAPAGEMKRTLTLTGITVNAMALIAPGAFLWTTFQLQASQKGGTTASDMWTGLFFSLVLALRYECQPWNADHRISSPVSEPVVTCDDRL